MTETCPAHLVALAERLADASGAVVRRYFRTPVAVDDKADASPVTIADREAERFTIEGLAEALAHGTAEHDVDVRLFGKPTTRRNRRMGVALASGATLDEARERALKAAAAVTIRYS